MADLFIKQAKEYQQTRPSYTPELIEFIVSKTPNHHLVWDVGCGSGQAAMLLAGVYKNVIGTDTSEQQLSYATKLPNIRYLQTPPNMSLSDLEHKVAARETVDLVTVAQALHWFDLPVVNEAVDTVFWKLYNASEPYWDPARKLVDDRYRNIDFPFEPVEGMDHTGPFEFVTERTMALDDYLTYIRSWSAYQTAKTKGVELLSKDVIENFKTAWASEDGNHKDVRYPVFLRIALQPLKTDIVNLLDQIHPMQRDYYSSQTNGAAVTTGVADLLVHVHLHKPHYPKELGSSFVCWPVTSQCTTNFPQTIAATALNYTT